MKPVKHCAICGKIIGTEGETDYYRYIRLKYCPACAKMQHRIQNANHMRKRRANARVQSVLLIELHAALQSENDALRTALIAARERIRRLEHETKS